MRSPYIDKTVLNLLTILITGAGFFAVLTSFSVPPVSFWGNSPYVIKRDSIQDVMTVIFTGLAMLGLIIQICTLIFGQNLKERIYRTATYTWFFTLGLLGMVVLLACLATIGRYRAKTMWWPKIIHNQSESFKSAESIIKNKGYYDSELDIIEQYTPKQRQEIPVTRYEKCDKILSRIEDLLELHHIPKTIEERYENVRPYFRRGEKGTSFLF